MQTLFAHTWLTLPLYINRAFVPWVSSRFELFANLSPLLVFVLAPLVAALTAKRDALKMVQWGTLVMAVPTFFLALGPSPATLFAYIVLMTVGESMWQPRFYDYITKIAPPGQGGRLRRHRPAPVVPHQAAHRAVRRLVPAALLPGRRRPATRRRCG